MASQGVEVSDDSAADDYASANRQYEALCNESYFVDKSLFILRIHEAGSVNVIVRPSHFGKTSAASMVETFFKAEVDAEGLPLTAALETRRLLFSRMKIAATAEKAHLGKFPVIRMCLSAVGEDVVTDLQKILKSLYSEHPYLALPRAFSPRPSVNLSGLIRALHGHYKKKVIVIIDDFDMPWHRLLCGYVPAQYSGPVPQVKAAREYYQFLSVLKVLQKKYLEFGLLLGSMLPSVGALVVDLYDFCLLASTLQQPGRFGMDFGYTEVEMRAVVGDRSDDVLECIRRTYRICVPGGEHVYSPASINGFVRSNTINFYRGDIESTFMPAEFIDVDAILLELRNILHKTEIEAMVARVPNVIRRSGKLDMSNVLSILLQNGILVHDQIIDDWEKSQKLKLANRETTYMMEQTLISSTTSVRFTGCSQREEIMSSIIEHHWQTLRKSLTAYLKETDKPEKRDQQYFHGIMGTILDEIKRDNVQGYTYITDGKEHRGRYDNILVPKQQGIGGHEAVLFECAVALEESEYDVILKREQAQVLKKWYASCFALFPHIRLVHKVFIIFLKSCEDCYIHAELMNRPSVAE